MKKIILKILIIFFIFFWSFNTYAFSYQKIDNYLNNFYSKLDKTNFNLEKKIEKLKIIKTKIQILKANKYNSLNPKTKEILTYIENKLSKKIDVYKNMLAWILSWTKDIWKNLFLKAKKLWINIKNCSKYKIYKNIYYKEKCENSIKNILKTLDNSKNKLKKSSISLRNCVFWKIYFKFSKNDKYYKQCLEERRKIREILIREVEWFNNLSDKEKSSYITKIFYKSLFLKKISGY